MDQRIYLNHIQPLHQTNKTLPQKSPKSERSAVPFKELLKEQANFGIKFSKHAEKRLAYRNIPLDATRLQRLTTALDQAAAKGAKESLLLMDDVAYVVSVENRMVITAVDDGSMEDNVFTNIDSAVIVR